MRNLFSYLRKVLLDVNTPLWVSIFGVLASGYLVYVFMPLMNAKFETQKIKSEYVMKNLDTLNTKTQELLSEISIINRKISNSQTEYSENIDKATRLITELQWKAFELTAVLDDPTSLFIIKNFQDGLVRVGKSVPEIKNADTALAALKDIRDFLPRSHDLINRVAALSEIKFKF